MNRTSWEMLLELSELKDEVELQEWCSCLKGLEKMAESPCLQAVAFLQRAGQGIAPYYRMIKRLQEAYMLTDDEIVRGKIVELLEELDLDRVREKRKEEFLVY